MDAMPSEELEDVGAHVERQVRALLGDELAGAEALDAFVTKRLVPWPGRAMGDQNADPMIAAEFGRARKTYAAALHLIRGGFGPQAAMLNRSLFEGMAVAHWAHANPEQAWELFRKHERHNELLWGDALTGVGWVEPGEMDAGTQEERDELADLFGAYGHRPWTGHKNLRELVLDIQDQWPDGMARVELWEFFRVAHRDNNQQLHSSVTALLSGASQNEAGVAFDSVPSPVMLDRALLGAIWCYAQTLTLLWDHFGLEDRHELDKLIVDARAPFIRIDSAAAKNTGRNDPCPCGSGKKFKRCHGA